MKIGNYRDVELEKVNMEGAEGASIRWLISAKDGAPNFATRLFEIAPGGHTPFHSHFWEHENFILEGEGALVTEDGDKPFSKGDFIYIPSNYKHSYKNTGNTVMKFLCMIPNEDIPKKKKKNLNPFASGVANNC